MSAIFQDGFDWEELMDDPATNACKELLKEMDKKDAEDMADEDKQGDDGASRLSCFCLSTWMPFLVERHKFKTTPAQVQT